MRLSERIMSAVLACTLCMFVMTACGGGGNIQGNSSSGSSSNTSNSSSSSSSSSNSNSSNSSGSSSNYNSSSNSGSSGDPNSSNSSGSSSNSNSSSNSGSSGDPNSSNNSGSSSNSNSSNNSESSSNSSSSSTERSTDEIWWTIKAGELTGYESGGKQPSGDVVIPSVVNGQTVTSIGTAAFEGNTAITSVRIPGSVKEIGTSAFIACSNLKSVIIEDGVETISYNAFDGCTNLQEVDFPATLTFIGSLAFNGCAMETVIIPENINGLEVTLDHCSFQSCANIQYLYLPVNINSSNAFNGVRAGSSGGYIAHVFYAGSQEEWESASINEYRIIDGSTVIHYNVSLDDLDSEIASIKAEEEAKAKEEEEAAQEAEDSANEMLSNSTVQYIQEQIVEMANSQRSTDGETTLSNPTILNLVAQECAVQGTTDNLSTFLKRHGITYNKCYVIAINSAILANAYQYVNVFASSDYNRIGIGYQPTKNYCVIILLD